MRKTKRNRLPLPKLDKTKWISSQAEVIALREKLISEQQGYCAILKEPLIRPSLDHDHYTGKCRGVLSGAMNVVEGKILKVMVKYLSRNTEKSFSEILRSLADYWEKDYSSGKYHYKTLQDMRKFLERCKKETIAIKLKNEFNIDADYLTNTQEILIHTYLVAYIDKLEKGEMEWYDLSNQQEM